MCPVTERVFKPTLFLRIISECLQKNLENALWILIAYRWNIWRLKEMIAHHFIHIFATKSKPSCLYSMKPLTVGVMLKSTKIQPQSLENVSGFRLDDLPFTDISDVAILYIVFLLWKLAIFARIAARGLNFYGISWRIYMCFHTGTNS